MTLSGPKSRPITHANKKLDKEIYECLLSKSY